MKLKRLMVAVARSDARRLGVRQMKRTPAETCASAVSSVGGSTGRIARRNAAEPTNENASTRSANGADASCDRIPPRLGPATYENARLPFRSEFASTYPSRGTSDTNSVLYETKKKTLSAPVRNATT